MEFVSGTFHPGARREHVFLFRLRHWLAFPNRQSSKIKIFVVLVCALACSVSGQNTNANPTADPLLRYWRQWRGPLANGVAPLANPPIEWSEKKNVRWKVELPGKGHSSPIVFGDRVYVMAAAPVGEAQKPVFDSAPGVHDSVPVTRTNQYLVMA